MKHKVLWVISKVAIACNLIAACGYSTLFSVKSTPPLYTRVPTLLPTPTPTETLSSGLVSTPPTTNSLTTPNSLATAQIDTYVSIYPIDNPYQPVYLYFDPAVWSAVPGEHDSNQELVFLTHNALQGCSMQRNLGMGVPSNWYIYNDQRVTAHTTYNVAVVRLLPSRTLLRVVYYVALPEMQTGEIAVDVGNAPQYQETCLRAAEHVLASSNLFAP